MPVNRQLMNSLLERLRLPQAITENAFSIAQDLCRVVNEDSDGAASHELVLRAMEHRELFADSIPILDGLLRQIGLFPYLNPQTLSLADALAYEAHRPESMDNQIVFHRAQAHVYHLLLSGENVALSAPTSFGKSLVIDAIIATGKFRNIVIVVPTLALIDETRRRLTERFRKKYKVITRPSQERLNKNIFVLTQERVLELEDWSFVDFFVIDEFYKLSPQSQDDERAALLNHAFYQLAKSGAQFYMLGPNISGVTDQNHLRVELRFVYEPNYHTVATEIHRLSLGRDPFDTLVHLCRELDAPTIIFCSSPTRASEVARRLVAAGLGQESPELRDAVEWLDANYHPEWHFREALFRGIGLHHGRIPRSLAQFVLRRFNDETIRFLACTSTLIEGVNTKARNIIVFDNRINREQIDLFTFNNIKGRSGRMLQYFVGHVYVFHPDPQTDLPFVDVPALSQSTSTPDSLIVQMDDEDLTEESRERRQYFMNQDVLSFEVIRANRGVDPERQVAAATRIANESDRFKDDLAWSGSPRYQQLQRVCELIIDEFGGTRLGGGSARNARQLAAMISNLRNQPTTRELVQRQLEYSSSADEAVTRVLDFLRMWAGFHFPRLLRAISNIQRDVLAQQGLPTGNYEWFASQVESLFLDPVLSALDEFGIPLELGRKLSDVLSTNGDLDEALQRLRAFDLNSRELTNFEVELMEDARDHL